MSLVNQMLRDLEKRRAGERHGQGIFQGLRSGSATGRSAWPLVGLAAVVVLLGGAVVYLLWERQQAHTEPAPELVALPMVDSPAVAPAPTVALPVAPTAAPAAAPVTNNVRAAPVFEPQPEPTPLPIPATPGPVVAAPAPLAAAPAPQRKKAKVEVPATAAEPAIEAPTTIEKRPLPPTPQQLAATAYQQGYALLSQGKRDEAEQHFRTALQHDPAHVAAREGLAGLLLGAGRQVEAAEVLEIGLGQQPGNTSFRKLMARLQVEQGNLAAAVATLEAGASAATRDPEYLALLGALHQRQGAFGASTQRYQQALTLNPRHGVWWLGLGISQEGAGQRSEAAAAYRRALENGIEQKLASYARERLKALEAADTKGR